MILYPLFGGRVENDPGKIIKKRGWGQKKGAGEVTIGTIVPFNAGDA